ncbi:PDZ domain-containing protein [Carnobacterium iners]|uniref:PDZ domain-containing protein n=1 Tax=Carnobacterium iners TaxID=1073423 RepID=A0A1X7MS83_9LACT|nr:PDZ domain-containing protein [Carnobacterium iners]SEK87263.1 PDZ domain-containing protein [Carnobacterium iners]SMH26886.1 PDZ domain-containing protein [Carnobacterium iners]
MQLTINFLIALLVFFIQPVFLVGLIIAIMTSYKRIKNERLSHRVAIYKELYELKNYILFGLITGLIGSLLISIIGIPITMDWIIIYELVAIVLLIGGYRFISPLFTFPLATLIILGIKTLRIETPLTFLPKGWYQPFEQAQWVNAHLVTNVLFITVFLVSTSLIVIKKQADKKLTPWFLQTKRGKKIAYYQVKPFWFVPLLMIIPGESFGALFDWWPVFALGNQQYSFFLLPVLIGMRITVNTQLPKEAVSLLVRDFSILVGLTTLLAVGSIWTVYAGIAGLLLLLLGGFLVLYRHRRRENNWTFLFGAANDGVKVIAVRPDTPAEKMKILVGDTIVSCNNQKLETEDDFYQALSKNSVYCHLKVKGPDGELRLTETALYADSPHEIGVVLL